MRNRRVNVGIAMGLLWGVSVVGWGKEVDWKKLAERSKPIFGPVMLTQTTEKPTTARWTLDAPGRRGAFNLRVLNGTIEKEPLNKTMEGGWVAPGYGVKYFHQVQKMSVAFNGQEYSGDAHEYEQTWRIAIQAHNVIEVEIHGEAGSLVSVAVVPAWGGSGGRNVKNDLSGQTDRKDAATRLRIEPDPQAVTYVLSRAADPNGPWTILETLQRPYDESLRRRLWMSFSDSDPRRLEQDWYYKVEAYDEAGRSIRNYEPIKIPKPEEDGWEGNGSSLPALPLEVAVVEPVVAVPGPIYNTAWFTDRQLTTDDPYWDIAQIQFFLLFNGSFLSVDTFMDVDGFLFNPATMIYWASVYYQLNPQAVMTMMQKEQSAITITGRLPDLNLRRIMGWLPPGGGSSPTLLDNMNSGTAQLRRDLDRLNIGQPTAGNWKVGVAHAVTDSLTLKVTPATKAVACLFSYNPELGSGWGGTSPGGNFNFHTIWYVRFGQWGFTTPREGCVKIGTLIKTPSGPRPIETLSVGEVVLGWDGQCEVPATILKTFIHHGDWRLYQVQDVWLTSEHQVFISDRWQAADVVSKITEVFTGDVYDLTTTTQNFYSAGGVLIHNKKIPRTSLP